MDQDALTQLLSGQYVRLWPFVASLFPRDTLARVWTLMEAEDAWPRVMWWQDAPDREKGNLAAFALYMRDKTPLLVESSVGRALVGLVWFDEIIQGLRGNISIWYTRSAWGSAAEEATRIATRYGHECLLLPAIWGVSPWKAARTHALRCGYKDVATLERYVYLNNKPMPMYFTVHEE